MYHNIHEYEGPWMIFSQNCFSVALEGGNCLMDNFSSQQSSLTSGKRPRQEDGEHLEQRKCRRWMRSSQSDTAVVKGDWELSEVVTCGKCESKARDQATHEKFSFVAVPLKRLASNPFFDAQEKLVQRTLLPNTTANPLAGLYSITAPPVESTTNPPPTSNARSLRSLTRTSPAVAEGRLRVIFMQSSIYSRGSYLANESGEDGTGVAAFPYLPTQICTHTSAPVVLKTVQLYPQPYLYTCPASEMHANTSGEPVYQYRGIAAHLMICRLSPDTCRGVAPGVTLTQTPKSLRCTCWATIGIYLITSSAFKKKGSGSSADVNFANKGPHQRRSQRSAMGRHRQYLEVHQRNQFQEGRIASFPYERRPRTTGSDIQGRVRQGLEKGWGLCFSHACASPVPSLSHKRPPTVALLFVLRTDIQGCLLETSCLYCGFFWVAWFLSRFKGYDFSVPVLLQVITEPSTKAEPFPSYEVFLRRKNLEQYPPGEGGRYDALFRLACALHERYKKEREIDDLNEAIDLHRAALKLRPVESVWYHRSRSLNNLACCLSDRYDEQGAVKDLERAITLGRRALGLRPPGHPLRGVTLHDLAAYLNSRFDEQAVIGCLEEAISLSRAALELRPPGHPDRDATLNNLALYLKNRFNQQAAICDLEEAISLARVALELRPPGHRHRDATLQSRSLPQGQEAISLLRAALEFCPPGHPDRGKYLYDLAHNLWTKFQKQVDMPALHGANSLHQIAPVVHPTSTADLASSLLKLSLHLWDRFQREAAVTDLDDAIYYATYALELRLPRDSHRERAWVQRLAQGTESDAPAVLGREIDNLGALVNYFCLADRFRQQSATADLDEAILLEQEVLQVLIPGDPGYDLSQCSLATYLRLRVESRAAVTSSNASPVTHFDVEQLIRNVAFEILKTIPTRLLHTHTGILCNRHAQLTQFMNSQQYKRLVSLCTVCDPGQRMEQVHTAILKYFQYVMLSHRWGEDEPSLRDIEGHLIYDMSAKEGFKKLQTFCAVACERGFLWAWSDTCCIDKDSSAGLQEAIGSMFVWYRRSSLTTVYLSDVLDTGTDDARSRLQWASLRCTTRPEDIAYSLFGIFNLHLPVLYGESAENALGRLLAEIISQSGDISVLDWVGEASPFHSCFPAQITSFQTLPLLRPRPNAEEPSAAISQGPPPISFEDSYSPGDAYDFHLLTRVPLPRFLNRRLILPCIAHCVTLVHLKGSDPFATSYTYNIQAFGLRSLEITLPNKLEDVTRPQGSLHLVRPWHSKLPGSSAELDAATEEQLLSTLEWPFNALLLSQLPHNEHKRMASSTRITAQPIDQASILK
ncbi:hypothetical protein F5J12DRAFT_787205 [Pisolithus orientalis]|uniref:uncharacterized protein n=1 Tax=Pisolithus orientalis TaxID=936130 RepID=UPI0022240CB8|nr:uncharacterized protein F5J12DRAFT_787205 [Pisolithus orientalis]KAI5986694.1 hypothetical protein F5J12DRAFT_787205 [Pisolithus orientalis]